MEPRKPQPYGLRPTLRQLMIVVLGCAFIFVVISEGLKSGELRAGEWQFNNVGKILVLAPASIGLLLMFLDRPGPVREWLWRCWFSLLCVVAPALALGELVGFGRTWQAFQIVVLELFFVVGCVGTVIAYRHLRPGRCSRCRRLAVIPLYYVLQKPGDPPGKPGWCACCGQDYRRKGLAPWEPADRQVGDHPPTEDSSHDHRGER